MSMIQVQNLTFLIQVALTIFLKGKLPNRYRLETWIYREKRTR